MKEKIHFLYLLSLLTVLTLIVNTCTSIKSVPVRESHHSKHVNEQTDRIYIFDSIFIYVNGDTVRETRFRDRWRDKIIQDTVFLTDTIPKIVTIEVERRLNFWEKIKLKTWTFIASIIFIWCFIIVIRKWLGVS